VLLLICVHSTFLQRLDAIRVTLHTFRTQQLKTDEAWRNPSWRDLWAVCFWVWLFW
jgi:hypothetical protein